MTTGTPETYADDARRYLLRSRIATGGMGEVWRADDTTLGREVAVKLLKTEYADDPSFRARFETEARHAAALHHRNIASVYDFGEATASDGSGLPRPFLVMELVDGQPLSALLRHGAGLDPTPTRDLLAQAADGLGVAHAAGIVHRDVKPANLLVTPGRELKITDFGIARAAENVGLTQTGQVMGTPQYLSPEQARGETATPASDVYALGVVAFECLAGRRPFDKESPVATALAHLHDPVPDLPADVPADLAGVVRRALAKDPRERYADGAALAAALRDPAADAATQVVAPPVVAPMTERTQVLGAPVPAPVPTPPTTTTPAQDESERGRRTRWLVVLLLVLLGVAAVTAAVLATRGGDDTDEPPAGAETVRVREGDFTGRPVEEVADELTDLGLEVTTTEVANPGERVEGNVSSVDPSGRLTVGSAVEVSFWGPVVEEEPTPTEEESPEETPTQEETPEETPTEEETPEEPTPTQEESPEETPTQEETPTEATPTVGSSLAPPASRAPIDQEVAPR